MKNETRARIQSQVLDFLKENRWQDLDDFSLRLTDKLYEILVCFELSYDTLMEALRKIKTTFFVMNKVSKNKFANLLLSEIGTRLKAIVSETSIKASLTLSEIFPKMDSISDEKAKKYIKMIESDEKFLRESLVSILRKRGASPIPRRERDTAQ